MFRYRLRTLLIVMAVGPPVLALAWFTLPLLSVEFIAIGVAVAVVMLSLPWAILSGEAEAKRLRNEINQQRSKESTDNDP